MNGFFVPGRDVQGSRPWTRKIVDAGAYIKRRIAQKAEEDSWRKLFNEELRRDIPQDVRCEMLATAQLIQNLEESLKKGKQI